MKHQKSFEENRPRKNSNWKQRGPNVVGAGADSSFAAPVDLFVFNVNTEVSADAIIEHMKQSKN